MHNITDLFGNLYKLFALQQKQKAFGTAESPLISLCVPASNYVNHATHIASLSFCLISDIASASVSA
jgi:hypothetical protein